ncbi:MAG: head-tail adaptor protein [Clostridia bacterium]|nr:head-tail adaptor protein [Clostridia bacterium]
MYRPSEAAQMTTPMRLQTPTTVTTLGVSKKTWADVSGVVMVNMKSYGGTETTANGVLSIEDTAQIVCWYRPDIRSDCRLLRLSDGSAWEILGEPENIEMRNQFLKFKVRRVKGGA